MPRETLKRTVTYEPCPSSKRIKTNAVLTRDVSRLIRKTAQNAPEIRQENHYFTVSNTAPTNLVNTIRDLQDSTTQEIHLYRVRVAYEYIPGDAKWAMLYGTDGFVSPATGLFNTSSPHDITNFLVPPDDTLVKVYKSLNFAMIGNYTDAGTGQPVTIDLRFSNPKKIKYISEGPASTTAVTPIYFIGGHGASASTRTIRVSLWYSQG